MNNRLMVVKRDGKEVVFDRSKIYLAILAAMNDCKVKNAEQAALIVLDKVIDDINTLDVKLISVEKIQDIVENALMDLNKKVAKAYHDYRQQRSFERDKNSKLYKEFKEVVECKDVKNANANVDEYSFGGRKFEAAGILHKKIALDELPKRVSEAHINNIVYQHDLDSHSTGMHNCLNCNLSKLLSQGFSTRNGDCRPANSINTAMQLVAVIFQIQSQEQFGGVGSIHIDYDLAPYVKKSFKKHLLKNLKRSILRESLINKIINCNDLVRPEDKYREKIISIFEDLNGDFRNFKAFELAWNYAIEDLNEEGKQSAQALYHNLNTLESRPGSQVPFTSINFGRDISVEGRLVSRWLLNASIEGIGKFNRTSIFPISIFQYKKGVNDRPGTPNYDLFHDLVLNSISKRIYPNIVNCDWSQNIEEKDNPDTYMATMGCRTLIGYDEYGLGYNKQGRGNACPVTIILPKLALQAEGDESKFYELLDEALDIAEEGLLARFEQICKQHPSSARFMYGNGTIVDAEKCIDNVWESQKHNTLGVGYLGMHEACVVLYGKGFYEDNETLKKAMKIQQYMADRVKEMRRKHHLNFSQYASPSENLCYTAMQKLKNEFGEIKGVTDREYLTNSHHVPVFAEVPIFKKLKIESNFCKNPQAGCITYIELDGSVYNNLASLEQIINYAMNLDIPYLALNIPLDMCEACGYQDEINQDTCPKCGSNKIQRLRRVTGYLTTDYRKFNKGKQQEVEMRVKHNYDRD